MTSLTGQNNKMLSLLAQQREKIDRIEEASLFADSEKIHKYRLLINYIEDNFSSLNIYTLTTLRIATRSSSDKEVHDIVQYFGGGFSNLFDIKYCYYLDNGDLLDINRNEFLNYTIEHIEPVDIDGREIEDFDPDNLSFYCVINDD